MSNVSPGAAYVHDPEGAGYVYHRSGSFGPGRKRSTTGSRSRSAPRRRRHDRALLRRGPRRAPPPYAALWLSEPDHTGHHTPLGSPEHRAAIAAADRNVARVPRDGGALDAGDGSILFATCSDHGMQTIRARSTRCRAGEAGFKASPIRTTWWWRPRAPPRSCTSRRDARTASGDVSPGSRRRTSRGVVIHGEALRRRGPAGRRHARHRGEPRRRRRAQRFGVRGRSDVAENALGGESLPGTDNTAGSGTTSSGPFSPARRRLRPAQRRSPASLVDIAPTILATSGCPGRHARRAPAHKLLE
jgi:arylsulfatase A-like enzyme